MDADTPSQTGFSPSPTARSRALRQGPRPKHPLQITTRTPEGRPDFKFELLPLHSPLLRQSRLVSFPPLIDMLKFSGYPYLIRGQPRKSFWRTRGWQAAGRPHGAGDKAPYARGPDTVPPLPFGPVPRGFGGRRPNTQAALEGSNDARTGMPPGVPGGAMCVQRLDDSLNSAIHITYRSSLRSSSMPEPRDPLLKVLTDLYISTQTADLQTRVRVGVSGGHSPGGSCPPTAPGVPGGGPAEATRYDRHGWEVGTPPRRGRCRTR